ncbi:MAG: hypothetical protein KIT83_10340 [Bryobacterales bacterium]|nr:hypothetical protein [Bryobacterales bacterium]
MLRIDVIQSEKSTVYHLEGQLIGEWVETFRLAWVEAQPREHRVDEYVDLNLVTRVDPSGLHLLHVMYLAGVRFVASAPYTVSLLEELNGAVLEQLPEEAGSGPARRFRILIEERMFTRPAGTSVYRA